MKWMWSAAIGAAVCTLCSAGAAYGQNTNSGDIRGTVTDPTGATVPGVTVTVLNVDKGISKDFVTNQDGLYDTGSVLLGQYKITFVRDGFSQLVREGVNLSVGLTTVNGVLQVGGATEQIVVNTDVPLLKTETGEQSTTFEAKSMAQLPNVGQDWENFALLLPGSSGLGVNAGGQVASFNGNLPYNSVLADGASSTLSHSSNADVNVFETVQEVQISTSSFSAQYGIGGAIFNQISKGGTNKFHGSLYEYFQNDALNAASYQFVTGGATRKQAVGFERYNNFGGSVGGPVLKNRAFFYFDYDKTLNHGASSTGTTTVPTLAMRSGDFSAISKTLYDPATTTLVNGKVVRQTFAQEYGQGNKIPVSRFDAVSAAINAYYPAPNTPGQINATTGQTQNNFFYNTPNSNPFNKYFGRFDIDITANNRLTMSDTQRDNPATFLNQGICPINCQNGDVDSNNAQVSDVWNLSSRTINEARLGYTSQLNYYTPYSINQGFPDKLGWQFAKADTFPDVQVDDGTYELGPQSNAVYKEGVFDPSDVVTMIRGKHILHFGGEFLIYRDDSTAWGNLNAGSLGFTGQYTASTQGDSTSGLAYADFLLGQMNYWYANNSPEYGGRQKDPQVFVQDDYKIRPNLTVNLGLRYQIQTGWTEVKGNMATWDPTVQNPTDGSLGAIWYGTSKAHGRNRLQSSVYDIVLPRVGFSWQAHPNTVFRGGFGVYSYNWSLDTYGAGMGAALGASGGVGDTTNGVRPVAILSSDGSTLPFVNSPTTPNALNGQTVSYNQFHTPVPKIYQWNFGMQQEIGTNLVAEVSYVASHGFGLNFPTDLNATPVALLGPDSLANRPHQLFQSIQGSTNNAISNYNSLQAAMRKRLSSGLSFDFNYTWAHFLDDQDSSSWGGRGGSAVLQNAYDPGANYGPSNFDVRNAFKGRIVWEVPVGHGRRFLNKNYLLDAALGGWQISSNMQIQSGNPFTITAPAASANLQASANGASFVLYPNLVSNVQPAHRTLQHWFNESAFSQPAAYTLGNLQRNSLYGPKLEAVDASLGKVFHIWEATQVQVRADATNVFNHPGFGKPNGSLTLAEDGTFAANPQQINSVAINGRVIQLGARLSF